jgi:hypothetical protein
VPVQDADYIYAILTLAFGIYYETRYVSWISSAWNTVFFVVLFLTTDLPIPFIVILITYLAIAWIGIIKKKKTLAFLFLGSRGYGSMQLSMALEAHGLLGWIGTILYVGGVMLSVGYIGYVFFAWLIFLFTSHIVGLFVRYFKGKIRGSDDDDEDDDD